jgi:hypothetical protein
MNFGNVKLLRLTPRGQLIKAAKAGRLKHAICQFKSCLELLPLKGRVELVDGRPLVHVQLVPGGQADWVQGCRSEAIVIKLQ